MFDFFDSDAFTIGLEIVFLLFIGYDFRKYLLTRKREYLMNIALAVGFFIWTAIPFYNKYYTWSDTERSALTTLCAKEHDKTLCECLTDTVTKEYAFSAYETAFETPEMKAFQETAIKECRDG